MLAILGSQKQLVLVSFFCFGLEPFWIKPVKKSFNDSEEPTPYRYYDHHPEAKADAEKSSINKCIHKFIQ